MVAIVDAPTLRSWLNDGEEIAVLDVRDGGPYARGHILVATSVPRANFETLVPRLVPRRATRIVLTDDDGSLLGEAAGLLEACEYPNVHVLERGNAGWTAAGYQLFSGSNIVSKVFGELVEERCATPHVDASTLNSWIAEGHPFRLFDVRPLAEYRTVSIPGATNCPGMETVLRIPAHIDDASTPIVVNCAGRTRSIIGAQSLRDAGIVNPVFALQNGTMGWQLEGFVPDHGQSNIVTEPFGESLDAARSRLRDLATRHSVRFIDRPTLDEWTADTTRTTYLFDVRLAEAYSLGHIPGSVNAPGGQLIQSTDTFAAVRHARIVLVDEHGVQAVMTAHWMARMGWEVAVLASTNDDLSQTARTAPATLVEPESAARAITAEELQELLSTGACDVVDVGESYWYRQGRIPGSHYAMRSGLSTALGRFPKNRTLVFCCSTGAQAPFAAGDAIRMGFSDVRWLEAGRPSWRRAGGSFESIGDGDDELLLTPTDDMWYPPWARAEGAREAMEEYLSWEVGLVDRLKTEEYLRFSPGFDLN